MTCIVGIERKNTVWIGGDSAATSDDGSQMLIGDKKVFLNGDVAFGICGSPKIIDPLRFTKFDKSARSMDVRQFVGTKLVPAIKAAFKEAGCVIDHPEHGEFYEGAILIGTGGKLFRMEANFQLITSAYGFDSVGAGADIALGSLHASTKDSDSHRRIVKALEASAINNATVRPPFAVVSVKKRWL